MNNLTLRQQQILDLIRISIRDTGFPPTRAEIAARLGFRSANAAEEHLRALARKGAIELIPGASRGIRLRGGSGLPVVGQVAAGSPVLAEIHITARVNFDPRIFKPHADYLLRVSGMSMKNAGILDGDLLAVHRTTEATNGQIVVARIHDEVTVKRFQRRGSVVRLLAENPDFEPIRVDIDREPLVIEGIGVGIIRNSML